MSIDSLVIAPTLADMFDTRNNTEPDAAKVKKEQSIITKVATKTAPEVVIK
jgi:hypothetical protein